MLKIVDCDVDTFLQRLKGKALFIYGAGARGKLAYEEWNSENVAAIADGNSAMWGKPWRADTTREIISPQQMVEAIQQRGLDSSILLLTPTAYCMQVIQEMDKLECLDGLETYTSVMLSEYVKPQRFEFTRGRQRIPKVIHYCWFGGSEIPAHLQKYMQTWQEHNPDYEIIRWDESNYDVSKNAYMKEAYECKRWGFVPDYARLDIIYQHGGIYLDTDVEVLHSFDELLQDRSFFGVLYDGNINTGCGFGAETGNGLLREMRDAYDDKHFIYEDGSLNLNPCQHYQNPIFKKHGFTTRDVYQNIDGNVVYPATVFSPVSAYMGYDNYSEKTRSVHWGELSWMDSAARAEMKLVGENLKHRLKRQKEIKILGGYRQYLNLIYFHGCSQKERAAA